MLAHKNLEMATGVLTTLVPLYGDDMARIVIALRKLFYDGRPTTPPPVSAEYVQQIQDITKYLRLLEVVDKDLPEVPVFDVQESDVAHAFVAPDEVAQWAPLQTIVVDGQTESRYGIDQSAATACDYDEKIITWPRKCVNADFSIKK